MRFFHYLCAEPNRNFRRVCADTHTHTHTSLQLRDWMDIKALNYKAAVNETMKEKSSDLVFV